MNTIQQFFSQLRLARASLLNAPAFSLAVILTLSLTLTSLFVVLSLINVYFFKPLPVDDEARLSVVELRTGYGENKSEGFQSYPAMTHLYKNQTSFDRQFMANTDEFMAMNLPGEPQFDAIYATGEYFDILQVPLVLGAHFAKDIELEQKLTSVLISEKLWRQYFNSDASVIGQPLQTVNDRSFTIVGVVADSFSPPHMFKDGELDLWFPMSTDHRYFDTANPQPWSQYYRYLKVIGVRKPGLTNADVEAEFDQLITDIKPEWREKEPDLTSLASRVSSFRSVELGDKDHLSLFMLAGTLALVFIAMVNVSNLFFSRAVAQQRNLALQAVLGARRKTLFNALFSQTFLLVTVSMLVALFLSAWGIKLFKYLAQGHLPLVNSVTVDGTLIVTALIITIILAYLFSWLNAKLINYEALNTQIQASGKGNTKQLSGSVIKTLIGLQMLLACIVVISSQMALTKSLNVINKPLGSKVAGMYNVVAFIPGLHKELNEAEAYELRLQFKAKLEQQPGVIRVSEGESPVQKQQFRQAISDLDGHTFQFMPGIWVGSDYFATTGIKILEGRTFSEAAMRFEVKEMLVSKSAVEQLSPNESIIGRVYSGLAGHEYTVVGITEDFHHPLYDSEDEGRRFWWPAFPYAMSLIIEMEPGYSLNQEQALNLYREVNSRVTVWKFLDLESEYDGLLYLDRVTFWVCVSLAVFTILLAGVGIYGVLSYNLEARRYEFGIKMAVGAKVSHLYKLLAKETMLPLFIGIIAAIAISTIVYTVLQETLTAWLSFDATLVAIGILFTLVVALVAGFRPLNRVIKSEPMKALRNE